MTLADLLADGLFADGDWVETKDQDPAGAVRLIQLADVGDGHFRDRSSRFLTAEKARELNCTFLESDDVLVARMPEPLGRACIFPGVDQPAVTAVDVCIVRPDPKRARPSWLVHAINAPEFRQSMAKFVRGTTRQRISRRNLGSLTLAVPPLDEQGRTSAWLDEVGERRVSISDRLAAARAIVDRLRTAVLAAACSGRLTAEWHPGDADEALDGTDGLSDGALDLALPELPAKYKVTTLGAVSDRIEYGTSKKADTEGEVPVLRMGNIQDGRLDTSNLKFVPRDREVERLLLNDGDLLFNRTNSPDLVGKTAVFHGSEPMTFASYLIRVKFRTDLIDPDFVGMWLNSAWVKSVGPSREDGWCEPVQHQRDEARRDASAASAARGAGRDRPPGDCRAEGRGPRCSRHRRSRQIR